MEDLFFLYKLINTIIFRFVKISWENVRKSTKNVLFIKKCVFCDSFDEKKYFRVN